MKGVVKFLYGFLVFVVIMSAGSAQGVPSKAKQIDESSLLGDWKRGAQLHVVLHVTKGDNGKLTATRDSVDQRAYAILSVPSR